MTGMAPSGHFFLKDGIRLVQGEKDGVLWQSSPLRAIRLNQTAMEILEKCRTGFSIPDHDNWESTQRLLAFLDALCIAGILRWAPPDEVFEPYVSIIVPVYNRGGEIGDCIESLLSLDYPESHREIIVVDDASRDRTPAVVRGYDVRLMIQPRNLGPSAARNAGVRASKGELIAFIDSDCIADPQWLRELIPFSHDPRLALVGGFVDGFFTASALDRYEKVHSALNMGQKRLTGQGRNSIFYVPACNMVVRKTAFEHVNGMDEGMRLGEDVDLCWKLMAAGYRLMYTPRGRVRHKHRNRLLETFRRRFDYGTSEATLYQKYRQAKKVFSWRGTGVFFLLICAAGLTLGLPAIFGSALLLFLLELWVEKRWFERKFGMTPSGGEWLVAAAKRHVALAYHIGYHISRYYLIPAMVLCLVAWPLAPALLALILLAPVVEYLNKKPELNFPIFLVFFFLEQLFYQTGVFWGCVKQGSFRPYRVSFTDTSFRGNRYQNTWHASTDHCFEHRGLWKKQAGIIPKNSGL